MTPKPISIESGTQLTEAEKLMEEHSVRHLPVIEDGQLVDIISKGELRQALMTELPERHPRDPVAQKSKLTVGEEMRSPVVTITPTTHVVQAAQLMLECKIGALPVLVGSRLVGILTDTDLIQLLVRRL